MKIAISGSTGFIGKQLTGYLFQRGHEISVISRNDFTATNNQLAKLIISADVILNLAGSSVLCRWNQQNKQQILSSRIDTTRLLVDAVRKNAAVHLPEIFLNASAIGIYQEAGIHDESSDALNTDFLASVCNAWENETAPLKQLNLRTCILRTGIVLGTTGGSFAKMFPLFKFGLGGKIGSGMQSFSFIHIADYCRAILHLIDNPQSSGTYNMVSPEPTTNESFTRTLAGHLHRPAFFTVPEFALRLVYGQAAELLTKGVNVRPARLLSEGFQFNYPDISSALLELVQIKLSN